MTAAELEAYLHRHIPISGAMEISVREVSASAVRLRAALQPNLNHRSTAFGGSVASLAVLAGWSLLRVRLDGISPTPQIVIQRSAVEYLEPIPADFDALCVQPDEEEWQRFLRSLSRHAKGRIELEVEVTTGDQLTARFQGSYVAVAGDR